LRTKLLSLSGALALVVALGGCQPKRIPNSVSGTIETDEVHVASRYGGRVVTISAQEGDTLKAGQMIIELEATELKARRNQAAALLTELEAGPRKEEIEAARSEWEAQKAELEFARVDAERAKGLYQQKAVSETDRDRAVSRAQVLEKSVAAAKSRYDLLLAGTRPERIAQARAQLAEIDTQIGEMRIVAPGDSVLEVLHVKVGDVLAPNREVATLLLPQHIWVRVFVPEPWLGHIKLHDAVNVRVDSFPNKDFSGTVEQIGSAAEFTPRNVQTVDERIKQVFGIKVRLDNREGQLRAGMSADVIFGDLRSVSR
jgi:multidrug resistance efflux pump